MRLTLRTLLAYLDNSLEPQDAEVLRTKLSESGFATQLVQRIRAVLSNPALSAPSPEAVDPIDDANVIGEYLDSTLPVEQVAETERACLESDSHLAEAAACHQILTIVLKQPAEIPEELRQRIHSLPDRSLDEIATGGSFSSVTIPPEASEADRFEQQSPTSPSSLVQESTPVRPVGPDDSGVSDAPTRLRQVEAAMPIEARGGEMAGSRPRNLDQDTRIYGGSIRPSRITPWLVSLGLAAVLLFVLGQLFRPLFQRRMADKQDVTVSIDSEQTRQETVTDVEEAEPAEESDSAGSEQRGSEQAGSEQAAGAEETGVAGEEKVVEATATEDTATEDANVEQDADDSVTPTEPETIANDDTDASEGSPSNAAKEESGGNAIAAADEQVASESMPEDEEMAADESVADQDASVPVPPQPQPPVSATADDETPPPADAGSEPDKNEVARLINGDSLLVADVSGNWGRLKADAKIVPGVTIFAAPTFRNRLSLPGGEITLIGPCEVEWIPTRKDDSILALNSGKLLIEAQEAGLELPLQLGQEVLTLRFAEPDTRIGVAIDYYRSPGLDPLVPDNRIPVTSITTVRGDLNVESKRAAEEVAESKQRMVRGMGEPTLVDLEDPPDWIDPAESPLDASARAGLLELVGGSQPLELHLREATVFRRSEVAALAGRTLLGMGQADIYFGGDGLFNEPKQRAYWSDHYSAVLAEVDRSVESAEQVHDSIVRMDSANANALLRLLTGFTQQQLEQGADEELVEYLDSPSMAVRVFALENLHRITGTTLYFRPDQDNPVRRSPIIKKWEARLRKGDIRWQE